MRGIGQLPFVCGLLIGLSGCAASRPAVEPLLPELEPPPPTFSSKVVALRTTLGRAAVMLEMRGANDTIRGSYCDDEFPVQAGCAVCTLAGESDPLDSAVVDAMVTAFDRYPAQALEEMRVERVSLCAELDDPKDADHKTAGTVDLKQRRLFISLKYFMNSLYDAEGSFTVENIIHHELFHLFEYERMHEMYSDDPEWRLHNPIGFSYGYKEGERPAGFVNVYATSNENEDRASVFEQIMAAPDRLCEIAKADDVVRDKVSLVWLRTANLAGEEWLKQRAPCIDWAQPQVRIPHYSDSLSKKQWLTPPSRY